MKYALCSKLNLKNDDAISKLSDDNRLLFVHIFNYTTYLSNLLKNISNI